MKTMISKAPSHLKSKEDHKTVRALYLETPDGFKCVHQAFGYVDICNSGRSFPRSETHAFRVLLSHKTRNQFNCAKI